MCVIMERILWCSIIRTTARDWSWWETSSSTMTATWPPPRRVSARSSRWSRTTCRPDTTSVWSTWNRATSLGPRLASWKYHNLPLMRHTYSSISTLSGVDSTLAHRCFTLSYLTLLPYLFTLPVARDALPLWQEAGLLSTGCVISAVRGSCHVWHVCEP